MPASPSPVDGTGSWLHVPVLSRRLSRRGARGALRRPSVQCLLRIYLSTRNVIFNRKKHNRSHAASAAPDQRRRSAPMQNHHTRPSGALPAPGRPRTAFYFMFSNFCIYFSQHCLRWKLHAQLGASLSGTYDGVWPTCAPFIEAE